MPKMIPSYVQRRPLDSCSDRTSKIIELPKSVTDAEKWLRRHASTLYSKTASLRNCGIFHEFELDRAEVISKCSGLNWNKVKPFFLKFCGVKDGE